MDADADMDVTFFYADPKEDNKLKLNNEVHVMRQPPSKWNMAMDECFQRT